MPSTARLSTNTGRYRFFLKRYDSNGDGLLSTAEFANVLRLQHRHRESAMTEAQVAAAVALVDRNKGWYKHCSSTPLSLPPVALFAPD